MRARTGLAGWILAVILMAGCVSTALAVKTGIGQSPPYGPAPENGPRCFLTAAATAAYDPQFPRYGNPGEKSGTAGKLGKCKISVLGAYFWRDWMPIVSRPGPDRGSPLRGKVKMWLDNSMGDSTRLSFRAVMVDDKGQFYTIPFHVLPNYRVLPDEISNKFRDMGEEARKEAIAGYNVIWDGSLKPGESREMEISTAEGPYLPVGSHVRVEVTWTDRNGNSAVIKTLDEPINRTD